MKSADLSYAYRHALRDHGATDDKLVLHVSTPALDLPQFAGSILPVYITAFEAYRSEFLLDPAQGGGREEHPTIDYNPRAHIIWVDPVQFWDAELLRRALGKTPEQILTAFEGKIESARLLAGGVYVVGSSEPLAAAEFRACAARMKKIALGQVASTGDMQA